MVPCVQIVTRTQTVVWVKVHFLVDTGVTQQVEQDLLRHARRAEVLHFCRRSDTQSELAGRAVMSHSRSNMSRRLTSNDPQRFDFRFVLCLLNCSLRQEPITTEA